MSVVLTSPITFLSRAGVSLNFWSAVFVTIVGEVFAKRSYIALAGIATGKNEQFEV